MSKSMLYIILLIETLALIGLGILFITQSPATVITSQTTTDPSISLSSRAMTVYVKSAGKGDTAIDIVGKVYVQDDATGRIEFLFDVGAGCFPTWTLNPQDGYNLLISDDVDQDTEFLDILMREGLLRYEFSVNSDVQITKTMGIRSATLIYDDKHLRLNQQCS